MRRQKLRKCHDHTRHILRRWSTLRKRQKNTKTFFHTESETRSHLCQRKPERKEKQRIVKITEYPETSEKNTVEISNARKTFAEIQKEETAAATEEAISISNRATKKVLENYLTTEEIETKITASKEAVEAGVAYTLKIIIHPCRWIP